MQEIKGKKYLLVHNAVFSFLFKSIMLFGMRERKENMKNRRPEI